MAYCCWLDAIVQSRPKLRVYLYPPFSPSQTEWVACLHSVLEANEVNQNVWDLKPLSFITGASTPLLMHIPSTSMSYGAHSPIAPGCLPQARLFKLGTLCRLLSWHFV